MLKLRRYAYGTFFVACAHLIFGAIVRISGSGMGCGDHWPKCYGSFFPPLDRPDLIIEVSHRYLASILLLSLIGLLVAAWRRRGEAGVGGTGGVLRAAGLGVALGFSAALLGAVTVKLGNAPLATLAHWTVAMSLVATVVATLIRAGGLGGESPRIASVSRKAVRGTFAAAAMALLTVVMGGLTAKFPGAAVACRSFPLCGANPDVLPGAVHVQLTHRILAVLLVLHLIGVMMGMRKRKEPSLILRAAAIALSLGVLQLLVAGAMIGMHLPPILRSLHEAVGVSVWIATFALAYLARRGGDVRGVREPRTGPAPDDLADAGEVRVPATARLAFSTAIAEPPPRGAIERKESWQGASAFENTVVAVPMAEALAPESLPVTEPAAEAWETESASPQPIVVATPREPVAPESRVASLDDTTEPVIASAGADEIREAVAMPAHEEIGSPAVGASMDAVSASFSVPVVADITPSTRIADEPTPRVLHLASAAVAKLSNAATMRHSIAVIVARGADL